MDEILLDTEFRNLIPPLKEEEIQLLEQSLLDEGNRDPIVVWDKLLEPEETPEPDGLCKGSECKYEYKRVPFQKWEPGDGVWECPECGYGIAPFRYISIVLDGYHRYELCKKHSIPLKPPIELHLQDREEAKIWVIQNQFGRRNLSPYQRSVLALKLEDIYRQKAGERQGTRTDILATLPESSEPLTPIDTRHELAQIARVGDRTLDKVKKIEEKAAEEEKAKLVSGEATINQVYTRVKRLEENKAVEDQKVQRAMPLGQYSILLADPPWESDFSPTSARRTQKHYPTLTLDKLKVIKVPSAENAMLFLWTTAPMLKQALELMEAWGFEYRTNAVWDKEVIGTGYYFRTQHEILLVGKKGEFKAPAPENRNSSLIRERRGEHSKKPETIYGIIEKMYPGERYFEVFRIKQRKSWDGWGNEPSTV